MSKIDGEVKVWSEETIEKREVSIEETSQNTIEELCKDASKHYDRISTKVCEWNNIIPQALLFYSQKKTLLSSLEKVQKERDDWKELYKVEREEANRWIDKCDKLKVSLEKKKEKVTFWKKSYNEELAHSKQAEERIKELETILASIKADPSIGKLEIVDGFGEGDCED